MSENKSMLGKQSKIYVQDSKNNLKFEKYINLNQSQKESIYVIPFIFCTIGIVSYIISLTGCEATQAECLRDFDQRQIKYFVLIILISAISFTLNYEILMYKKNNLQVTFFQTIILLYLCFVHDTGSTLKNHGAYNRIFLAALMTIFFIIFNIFMFVYFIMRIKLILTILFIAIASGLGCNYY